MTGQSFADRLKQAMADADLKQVDLIRLAGEQDVKLGKSQISQYASGKSVPRKDVLAVLAEMLGVSSEWLLGTSSADETQAPKADAASESASQLIEAPTTSPSDSASQTSAKTARPAGAPIFGLERNLVPAGVANSVAEKDSNTAPITTSTPQLSPDQDRKAPAMREFKKSSKLDNVLYDVRGPVVDEANLMERNGMHVLKLNIGNPAPFGFRTPDEVVYDMAQQLTDCEGYSDSKGLFSARKAIMQYAQIKGLPNVTIDDIYTGNGASELINLSMSALLDNGDEVLVPSPDYPLWTACVTLAGGKAVHYICDEEAEWYPDIADIKSKITPNTKAIVIINPNNPTGALYPRALLEEIVQIARENQLIIFSDEIYDRLVMDGLEHISIASLAPDLFCVTFSGLSKSHMIAGYRIGWMILSGNKRCAKGYIEGLNMLSNMRLCSNVPAQSIVQTALGGHQSVKDYLVPGGRIYDQRERCYELLNNIPGISCVKPKAAFYAFPKIDAERFNITNDEQFALDLLREKKVLIVTGSGFNWHKPDHFRIVYLPRLSVLEDAIGKIGDFLTYYRQ